MGGANCSVLQQYILHRMYPRQYPKFSVSAQLVDRESIFVPGGWDTPERLAATTNVSESDASKTFQQVIPPAQSQVDEGALGLGTKDSGKLSTADLQTFLKSLKKKYGKIVGKVSK